MTKAVLLLLLVIGTAVAFDFPEAWEQWKEDYGKTYETELEEAHRHIIWQANKKYVDEHNANQDTFGYTLKMNQFGDLESSEFVQMYNGYRMRPDREPGMPYRRQTPVRDLPVTVDWRTKGYVTGVKNQGQCGSCWAFSTTGSLEGQHFKATGKLVSLSEQNLVDCSGKEGNEGCNGGLMDDAFKYIKMNGGIDTEQSYPYTARDGTCHYKAADSGATLTGFVDVKSKSEADLQSAVATIGPISVAIDASHLSFQLYHSGVYDPFLCSQTSLDHGVLAVGYGTYEGKDYWLVKNSWGPSWGGLKGYIMMARNKNNKCGIATQASYPTV